MPTYFSTNHYFSETSNVEQKCWLWRQKHGEDHIKYGFTCLQKDGKDITQCELCMKTPANSFSNPIQLKQHLNNAYKEQASKSVEYLNTFGDSQVSL